MVTGNLQLQINYGDGGGSATLSLSNAYDLYNPEHLNEVISTYVAAIPPPAPTVKAIGIDRSRIIPVVKNRQWFDHVQERRVKDCNIRKGRSPAS